MAVRIRMKKLGRRHRPFFRICATDGHTPRDGRVLEELGTYDPSIADTDARVELNSERIDYWLSVGAQPSDKVGVLIKKYGSGGTHLAQQKEARDKLLMSRRPIEILPVAASSAEAAPAEDAPAETTEKPKAAKTAPQAEAAVEPDSPPQTHAAAEPEVAQAPEASAKPEAPPPADEEKPSTGS